MPHDRTGREIKVGDRVRLDGRVTSVYATDDNCNATVQIPAEHPTDVATAVTLNTRQTEVIDDGEGAEAL